MNILDPEQESSVSAEDIAETLISHIQITWARIVRSHELGMKTLWENLPEGISSQDVIDALGTKAGEAFQLSGALAELIGSIDPEKVVPLPEGVTVTINQDGTVTLS